MLRLDSGPPGFYVLEKPFAHLAELLVGGGGDGMLRLPSFLAAIALLFAAATLPRPSRIVFTAFASGAALASLYAAEARPYALLGLLGLAVFLLALTGEERPRRLLATAAVAAAALYTHYLAIFVVTAALLLALAARRLRSAVALASGAAAFLPWIPILTEQPGQAIAWMREPAGASLAGFLSALGGVGRIAAPFGGPAPGILFAAGVAVGVLLLAAASASARRDVAVRTAFAFTLVVLAGVFFAGLRRPVAFAGRTEMAILPVWIWGIARASQSSRAARWGAAAAAILGTVSTLWVVVVPRRSESQEVTAALTQAGRAGDVVVAAAGFYLPLRLQESRGRLAAEVHALPDDAASHPGWFVPALPGEQDARRLAGEVAALKPGGRLFLVLPPAYATRELVAALESATSVRGGRVRELSRGRDALVMLATPGSNLPAAPSGP